MTSTSVVFELFSVYLKCIFQEEVQSQFQRRFYELEMEVRDRDEAILDLQSQIYNFEVSIGYTLC